MEARKKTGRNPKGQFVRNRRMQLRLSEIEYKQLVATADLYTVHTTKPKSITDTIIVAIQQLQARLIAAQLTQPSIEEHAEINLRIPFAPNR